MISMQAGDAGLLLFHEIDCLEANDWLGPDENDNEFKARNGLNDDDIFTVGTFHNRRRRTARHSAPPPAVVYDPIRSFSG